MISQLPLIKAELLVTVLNKIPLVQLPTCLSLSEATDLKTTYQLLLQKEPVRIIFDFSQTTVIDRDGVQALVSSLQVAKAEEIELFFWSVHPQIKKTLHQAGINLFIMIDSETYTINQAHDNQIKEGFSHDLFRPQLKKIINILDAFIGLGKNIFTIQKKVEIK